MSRQLFDASLKEQVDRFPEAPACRRVDGGLLMMRDYHVLLTTIFHQVHESAASFALAAAHCPARQDHAREYLIQHADEEKTHWRWILNDLKTTGFNGSDPRSAFPPASCQAYVGFNFYNAMRYPIGRLGIAAMLESLGATHGKNYATKLCQALQLTPEQAQFFYGHGETDVGHTHDIIEVLEISDLTETDWAHLADIVRTAGGLYRAMYNAIG